MSKTIDERVVSMQFDNKQFEANVNTSMNTLDKLNQKLDLKGASKGLESVNTAAKNVNMSGLGNAVETVRMRFSALQVMGVTALANITNSAINAGKRMVSSLTIDQVTAGWTKYEQKTSSVQTIMNATGKTIDEVNGYLDKLMWYSDETSYGFTDMTQSLAQLTSAGGNIDNLIPMIEGIANATAFAGKGASEFSRAIYNLNQSYSAGYLQYMDWKSLDLAGVSSKQLKQVFIDTAIALGKLDENGRTANGTLVEIGNFGQTLNERWADTEVMEAAFGKFSELTDAAYEAVKNGEYDTASEAIAALADRYDEIAVKAFKSAQEAKTFTEAIEATKDAVSSGWMKSSEIIFGNYDEAKVLWTDLANKLWDIFASGAENRNEILESGLSAGWNQFLGKGIKDEAGYTDIVKSIAKEHGIAIDEMIEKSGSFEDTLKDGWLTSDMLSESITKYADKLRNMSDSELKAAGYTKEHIAEIEALESAVKDGSISLDEFAKKIAKPSGRQNLIDSLWNSLDGLLSVLEPIKEAFNEIFPPITAERLYAFTEGLKEFTSKLTLSETASNNLKHTFKGLFAVIDILRQAFTAIFKFVSPYIKKLASAILEVTASFGDWLVKLNETIKASDIFNKVFERVESAIKNAISKIKQAASQIGKFLKPIIEKFKEFGKTISETFKELGNKTEERFKPLTVLGKALVGILTGIGNALKKIAPKFVKMATGINKIFSDLMNKITDSIANADYDALFDVVNGGIIAAIGVFIAKFMKSASGVLDNASGFIKSIKEILGGVSETLSAFTQSIKAKTLLTIASAIGILAIALIALSLVDSEKLTVALTAITALFTELFGAMFIFGKISDGEKFDGIQKVSRAMVTISKAVLILAAAMKIVSSLSWSELARGLIAIVVGLGALVGAVNLLPKGNVNKAAKAIRKLATALLIFSIAMKILGSLSWGELARGLIGAVVGLGALVAAANLLPKDMALRSFGILSLATSMIILGVALKIMATMSWDDIGRSLVTLAGSLGILVIAMRLMKKAFPGAVAMMIIAPAIVILASALKLMATMSWEEVALGLVALGGSLLIIAGAMAIMRKAIPGAVALLIIAPALIILASALKLMATMSWEEIGKGLTALAGAFIIIGAAGLLLKPLIGTILKLSIAMVIFGVAVAAIGAGVLMFSIGLTALATSGAAVASALVLIVSSIIGLIPYLIEQIGVGIIKFCEVIAGGASAICEAATTVITSIMEAIVESVPTIVDGLLVLLDSLIESLVEYTPSIVEGLFNFLIAVLDSVAKKLPDLIQAGVNVLMAFFSGVIDALNSVDPNILANGILAVGILTALVAALAAIALLTPAAMIGVIGLGAVVTELGLVLSAIGILAQIPELQWLIESGGDFMQTVGTAIGKFIGGIVGGFSQGVSSTLPQIGSDLSSFMDNVEPFIEGAKQIDSSTVDGIKSLADVILTLTAANILEGLTSWFTGGSSLTKFGEELASFAPSIKEYADTVAGIDAQAIANSAEAAKALAEMTSYIPNEGGVVSWFVGENSISKFGTDLIALGTGLKEFADETSGIVPENITATSSAAKALAEMTSYIPNEGGVVSWFAGENSISKFGIDLILLGTGLKGFADETSGIVPENITAASGAAKSLAEMTQCIPNEGGMASWFAGENSISKFGTDLIALGTGLKGFADETSGIVPENIIAASGAAKSLAEMSSYIPNEGGVASWFAGENSISKFGTDLIALGTGLKGFADETSGIVPENITATSGAAKSLAEMTSYIPNEGGVVSWFTGENSISKFGTDLIALGTGLKGFADETSGIVPENITAASNAAKSLAEMTSYIPDEGGVVSWFTGESSISKFGSELIALGTGLKGFADETSDIVPENITAASNAAKSLAEMTSYIPDEGGIKAWFSGESGVATFADNLPVLGEGLSAFSDAVSEINPDNIVAASDAAKNLAEMTKTAPEKSDCLIKFGENIVAFGEKLSLYYSIAGSVSIYGISMSICALNAAKSVNAFSKSIDSSKIESATEAVEDMINMIKEMSSIKGESTIGFTQALNELGKANISAFIEAFDKTSSDIKKAGENVINYFVEGIDGDLTKVENTSKKAVTKFVNAINNDGSKAKKAFDGIITSCLEAIKVNYGKFINVGKYLVQGFASGIKENTFIAEAKAKAMAEAAYKAAKEALDVNSPSKIFRKLGFAIPEGLAMGIDKLSYMVGNSVISMTKSAINGTKDAISHIASIVTNDIDAQPTIRPVLDLSDVRSGANAIGNMLNGRTLSIATRNVGTINSMMKYNQNGANSDVISAIEDLGRKLGNTNGNTYNINGITYDDGSGVSDAIETLIRAAKIERRS